MTSPATPAPPARRSGSSTPGRLLIVSNRLPMTMRVHDGAVHVHRSSGGLATGLRGVHEDTGGIWIGWPGLSVEQAGGLWPEMQRHLAAAGAAGIPLSRHELAGFYSRYSNGALWPVLHDRVDHPAPDDDAWSLYRAVNQRYADAVTERNEGRQQGTPDEAGRSGDEHAHQRLLLARFTSSTATNAQPAAMAAISNSGARINTDASASSTSTALTAATRPSTAGTGTPRSTAC